MKKRSNDNSNIEAMRLRVIDKILEYKINKRRLADLGIFSYSRHTDYSERELAFNDTDYFKIRGEDFQ